MTVAFSSSYILTNNVQWATRNQFPKKWWIVFGIIYIQLSLVSAVGVIKAMQRTYKWIYEPKAMVKESNRFLPNRDDHFKFHCESVGASYLEWDKENKLWWLVKILKLYNFINNFISQSFPREGFFRVHICKCFYYQGRFYSHFQTTIHTLTGHGDKDSGVCWKGLYCGYRIVAQLKRFNFHA